MNRTLIFFLLVIFSIFLGSQITEGFLLVPYWKSLSNSSFYEYYSKFGPIIGRFYTILTIIAVLIPSSINIYCFFKKSRALKYSVISSLFALLIIALFYIYFNDINQQFYNAAFEVNEQKQVLKTWEYIHWIRVLLEILSLVFLIQSFTILTKKSDRDNIQNLINIQ